MAAKFYAAIERAMLANEVPQAQPIDVEVNKESCDKFAGSGQPAGGKTQRGSGNDDDIYRHNSEPKGVSVPNADPRETLIRRMD